MNKSTGSARARDRSRDAGGDVGRRSDTAQSDDDTLHHH